MSYLFQMELIFSGSSSFLDRHDMLVPVVGSDSWFVEFRPVLSEDEDENQNQNQNQNQNLTSSKIHFFHKLLYRLFCCRLCCFLSGTFVYSAAGIFDSFDEAAIFIVISDHQAASVV